MVGVLFCCGRNCFFIGCFFILIVFYVGEYEYGCGYENWWICVDKNVLDYCKGEVVNDFFV